MLHKAGVKLCRVAARDLTDTHYVSRGSESSSIARSHSPRAMGSTQKPGAVAAQDACTRFMLRETLKVAPIQVPLTPVGAATACANLAERAIAVLRPLTHPKGQAMRCATAVEVATLLTECVRKLRALDWVPPPQQHGPKKVAPVPREKKPARHELQYVGASWAADRVIALRRKVEQQHTLPYREVQDYIMDTVAADRQWTVARSYLNALHTASQVDGTINFHGREYTSHFLKDMVPKMRVFQAKRRAAAVKNTGHLFARDGVKTAKKFLGYSRWRAVAALKDRYPLH